MLPLPGNDGQLQLHPGHGWGAARNHYRVPGGSNLRTQSRASPGSEVYGFVANGLHDQLSHLILAFKETACETKDSRSLSVSNEARCQLWRMQNRRVCQRVSHATRNRTKKESFIRFNLILIGSSCVTDSVQWLLNLHATTAFIIRLLRGLESLYTALTDHHQEKLVIYANIFLTCGNCVATGAVCV